MHSKGRALFRLSVALRARCWASSGMKCCNMILSWLLSSRAKRDSSHVVDSIPRLNGAVAVAPSSAFVIGIEGILRKAIVVKLTDAASNREAKASGLEGFVYR